MPPKILMFLSPWACGVQSGGVRAMRCRLLVDVSALASPTCCLAVAIARGRFLVRFHPATSGAVLENQLHAILTYFTWWECCEAHSDVKYHVSGKLTSHVEQRPRENRTDTLADEAPGTTLAGVQRALGKPVVGEERGGGRTLGPRGDSGVCVNALSAPPRRFEGVRLRVPARVAHAPFVRLRHVQYLSPIPKQRATARALGWQQAAR